MTHKNNFIAQQAQEFYRNGGRMIVKLEVDAKHVDAMLDALVWASEEARHSAEIGSQYPWSYKRYELALDLLDVELRQAKRELREGK